MCNNRASMLFSVLMGRWTELRKEKSNDKEELIGKKSKQCRQLSSLTVEI